MYLLQGSTNESKFFRLGSEVSQEGHIRNNSMNCKDLKSKQ